MGGSGGRQQADRSQRAGRPVFDLLVSKLRRPMTPAGLVTPRRPQRRKLRLAASSGVDIRDSVPGWTPFEPPRAPENSPHVVYLVLGG